MWNCGNWLVGFPAGMGHFGGIFGLFLLLIIGYLIFMLRQTFRQKSRINTDKDDSLAILKTRLAEGTISHEEYQRIRDVLLH